MNMTNEEAIKKIDNVLSSDYHYDETLGYQLTSYDFEWLEKSKQALEKQIPKKPKHTLIKHGKHTWKKTEDGEIDDYAWDNDCHSGVICEVCGETVCVYCNPDYDELTDCEEEYWNCPSCGKKIHSKLKYCDCGQALDFSERSDNDEN